MTYTAEEIAVPCLYIWRRGSIVLYIGQSSRGWRRAFEVNRKWSRWEAVLPADTVEILVRPGSTTSARCLEERALIQALHPLWNGDWRRDRPLTVGLSEAP